MVRIKNKNAEITTQQIVILIILVTSFVIILFFIFKLNLGSESQKDICHNSVVLKGKSIVVSEALDCRTNYLCISGGGKCEGINPTETVKVNPNNKGEIMKAIASEMADCWWMFGEGKLDYLSIGDKNALSETSCAICSIVKFDKNGELLTSSYYGYNDNDEALSIYLTQNNDVLLAGKTKSDNLPTTQTSYQTNISDNQDAFIIVLDSELQLKWVTYLGGLEEDGGYVIKDDQEGNIIVLGRTESNDFPIFNGYQYTFGGLDGFISKFSSTGEVIWVSRTKIGRAHV